MFNCYKMTVQNYIGQNQQELDLSDVDAMIHDTVAEMLKEIFDEEGEIAGSPTNYYTKVEINEKLNDYLTESNASTTYATKTTLNEYYTKNQVDTAIANVSGGGTVDLTSYLTKSDASDTYATKSSLNNYETISNASSTYASKKTFNNYYTKSQVDEAIANVNAGGTVDLTNYLTISNASDTYATKTLLNDYLTESNAANTYATKTTLNDYYTKNQVDIAIANVSSGGTVDLTSYLTKSDASNTYATKGEITKYPFQTHSKLEEMFETFYPSDELMRALYNEVMSCADKNNMNGAIDNLHSSNDYATIYEELVKIYDYYQKLFIDGYISSDQFLYRTAFMDKGIAHIEAKSGE